MSINGLAHQRRRGLPPQQQWPQQQPLQQPQPGGRLPDFLIVGAMKAGTSTLHNILRHQSGVFFPKARANFFDIDDFELHPEFLPFIDKLDYDADFDFLVEKYRRIFVDAGERQRVGGYENSYMAAAKAPQRIAALMPDVKLIFVLRDPVIRTVSQYYHFVRYGRVSQDFATTIAQRPLCLLKRSYYREQIARFLRYFRRDQMMFIVFEDFVRDVAGWTRRVMDFLHIEGDVDLAHINTHVNKRWTARSDRLLYLYNRVVGEPGIRSGLRYFYGDAFEKPHNRALRRLIHRGDHFLRHKILLSNAKDRGPNELDLHRLRLHLVAANRGLSDLIEVDLNKFWS